MGRLPTSCAHDAGCFFATNHGRWFCSCTAEWRGSTGHAMRGSELRKRIRGGGEGMNPVQHRAGANTSVRRAYSASH
eukprot:3598468-Pleurochrysis_carterae.AAC.1